MSTSATECSSLKTTPNGLSAGLSPMMRCLLEDRLAVDLGLLVPGEAEVVGREAGDDVVDAVAVDVVGVHLRAAVGRGERRFVKLPANRVRLLLRLLEPTRRDEDVLQAVAVDVADAEAVAERLRGGHLRDAVERPRLEALLRLERGEAELAVRGADEFGLRVADEIHELRRLVADRLQHLVLLPRLVEVAGFRDSRRRKPGLPGKPTTSTSFQPSPLKS